MQDTTHTHNPDVADCIDCPCDDCQAALADFNAWVEDVRRRWHDPDCGPLCAIHGDSRDTSIAGHDANMERWL